MFLSLLSYIFRRKFCKSYNPVNSAEHSSSKRALLGPQARAYFALDQ